MKYGIISDIHSNIQAYETVLKRLTKYVDAIVCLGDIVGYNANPKECVALTKRRKKIKYVIKGNHDQIACSGLRFSESMHLSRDAYDGLQHTIKNIDEKDKAWLHNLKDEIKIEDPDFPFLAVHGAPLTYNRYEYIYNMSMAVVCSREIKQHFKVNLCFFGHTHVPTFSKIHTKEYNKTGINTSSDFTLGSLVIEDGVSQTYDVSDPNMIYLVNPGSVGQPRLNGIHSFVIFDSKEKEVYFETFEYDKEAAMKAVYDAGYSDRIARRLIEK